MTSQRPIVNALLLLLCSTLSALVAPAQSPQYIPVHVTIEPRHLLLVLPPWGEERSNASIARSLKRVPTSGWLVAVLRPDGSLTDYVSRDALKDALAAHALASTGSKSDSEFFEKAGADLAQLPGQKIVLIENGKGKSALYRASLKPLFSGDTAIFMVDGGENIRIPYDDSWGYSGGPSPQGDDFVIKRKPYLTAGIHHEVKLSAAVKDIVSAYGER